MSPRATRSATRLAADPPPLAAAPGNPSSTQPPPPTSKSRKRKAPPDFEPNLNNTPSSSKKPSSSLGRAAKKQKVSGVLPSAQPTSKTHKRGARQTASMAKPGYTQEGLSSQALLIFGRPSSATEPNNEKSPPVVPDASKRKSTRGKKSNQGM